MYANQHQYFLYHVRLILFSVCKSEWRNSNQVTHKWLKALLSKLSYVHNGYLEKYQQELMDFAKI